MQLRGTSDGRDDGLSEPVEATAEEFEKVEVSEDLELLADLVVNVGVFGMEFRELACMVIDIGEREFLFLEGADHVWDVESPAARFGFQFFTF
jgi:hypothetical protein